MIERAKTEASLARIGALLAANGLPVDDLEDGQVELFCRCAGDSVEGAVGLETYGDVGLIRSLVVGNYGRGHGIGSQLVSDLEAEARDRGVRQLYLLTTNAADFFRDRGYAEIDRAEVPDAIRGTRQFSSLCPGSAIVMRKELTR